MRTLRCRRHRFMRRRLQKSIHFTNVHFRWSNGPRIDAVVIWSEAARPRFSR